jgi:hypothetical protein
MTRFTLTDGPSRERLVDSFKYAFDANRFPVVFKTEDGLEFTVVIQALRHEDGSGQSFIFSGVLKSTQTGGRIRSRVISGELSYVNGYFYTGARRHGFIEFHTENQPV